MPPPLEDVEPLHDQDVGPVHLSLFPGEDVVGLVAVDGCCHPLGAGLEIGHKPKQAPSVEAFGEALAGHQTPLFEDGIGEEKSVSGDQVDPRVVRPSAEQPLEDTGGRRLPHRHRPGDTNHVGDRGGGLAEKGVGNAEEVLAGPNVEVEQSGEGEIDLLHLAQGEGGVDSPELCDIVLVQG